MIGLIQNLFKLIKRVQLNMIVKMGLRIESKAMIEMNMKMNMKMKMKMKLKMKMETKMVLKIINLENLAKN